MSILQTRLRAMAAATVVAASAATPAAIWYANEVLPERMIIKQAGALPMAVGLFQPPAQEPETTREVVVDEVVILEPRARRARRARRPPAMAPRVASKKRCVWHQSIALSNGKVRVCDVERPTTGQGARLLTPMKKPEHLGHSLDLPSPTGLLEAAQ